MISLAGTAGRLLTLLGVMLLAFGATACGARNPQPAIVPAGASSGQNTFLFLYTDD